MSALSFYKFLEYKTPVFCRKGGSMAAQKRMKEARGVTARITVEIPADLDEFFDVAAI